MSGDSQVHGPIILELLTLVNGIYQILKGNLESLGNWNHLKGSAKINYSTIFIDGPVFVRL